MLIFQGVFILRMHDSVDDSYFIHQESESKREMMNKNASSKYLDPAFWQLAR